MRNKILTLIIIISILTSCADPKQPITIAFIAESYNKLEENDKNSWPNVLKELLGNDYKIQNYETKSLNQNNRKTELLQSKIVIIELGHNINTEYKSEDYTADYQSIIDTFYTIKRRPRIIVCNTIPNFNHNWTRKDSTIENVIIPVIENITKRNRLELVDFHQQMKNDSLDFPDYIHPDEIAANKMAHIVYNKIKNIK